MTRQAHRIAQDERSRLDPSQGMGLTGYGRPGPRSAVLIPWCWLEMARDLRLAASPLGRPGGPGDQHASVRAGWARLAERLGRIQACGGWPLRLLYHQAATLHEVADLECDAEAALYAAIARAEWGVLYGAGAIDRPPEPKRNA